MMWLSAQRFPSCSFRIAFTLVLALATTCASAGAYAQNPAPPSASPTPQAKGLKLPEWLTKANWKPVAGPFEEAMAQGGALMLQLPKALERQVILARNNANRGNAEVRVAAAMRVARAGNANVQMEQQIKAMIPQYRNQYINILFSELQAIRSYCEVPKESREEVFKAAEEAYDKALEEFVRGMYMPTDRGQRGGMLRSSVRSSLVTLLEKKLPPAEFTKLSSAVSERSEMRKRICIESVVARMDDAMRLTPQQREKITESIRGSWVDDWESWLMLWQYEDNYLPQIEDALVVTHLTPQQRRIWQQSQKISLRGEMHSEFAGDFDAAFWNAKPKKAGQEDEVKEALGRFLER